MLNLIVTEREREKSKLRELLERSDFSAKISVHSAEDVSQACAIFRENPCRYDAIFLPADSGGNQDRGISQDVADIRNLNPYVQIVLMLSYNYIPASAAETGKVWLLRRPVTLSGVERLLRGLETTVSENGSGGHRLLTLRSGKENYYVASDSVLYAKKCRRGTAIITTKGEITHGVKLDEFQREAPWTFCRCHSSFIVNFRHAVQSGQDYILLDDGERIPISRAYRQNVKDFVDTLAKPQK